MKSFKQVIAKYVAFFIIYCSSRRNKILCTQAIIKDFNLDTSYEGAKMRKKIADFYLGKKRYLHYDREWDCHMPSQSFYSLEEYSKKYGNEAMLNSFRNDLIEILKMKLTVMEFNCIKTYIWIYLRKYYEDKSFEIEWRVEENIRQLIKNHIERYNDKLFFSLEDDWPSDGFIFKNILQSMQITKDRFGIDLLDIKGK